MFKDYNSYKRYKPQYSEWKKQRDEQEAKRLVYLKKHPELIKDEDIQRGKTLLQAIDILDEYSQASAENTEAIAAVIAGGLLDLFMAVGGALCFLASRLKPIKNLLIKFSNGNKILAPIVVNFMPMLLGGTIASLAAFPIMAWMAKMETGASRKGRLDAMKTVLNNPANFAILTEDQQKQLLEESQKIELTVDEAKIKTPKFKFKEAVNIIKNFNKQEEIEQNEREEFKKIIQQTDDLSSIRLSGEELEKAKRDQQILTKLVEKIDIASQDYTENVEFATDLVEVIGLLIAFGTVTLGQKINKLLKINPQNKIAKIAPWTVGLAITIATTIGAVAVQKQAARVGRFKARQELAQQPEQFVYVDDDKVNAEIGDDFKFNPPKKSNIFKFYIEIFKNNKEYKQYRKREGLEDKKLNKALEKIVLNKEQLEEAEVLQRNTFKTFNKIDEMSQKYSEDVEARGMSWGFALNRVCNIFAEIFGINILLHSKKYIRAIGIMLACFSPIALYDYKITKDQKSASRVANMQAIKELAKVENFAGYVNNKVNSGIKIDSKNFLG